MWSLPGSLLSLVLLVCHAQALYFYMEASTPKCFVEELSKDILVVGMQNLTLLDQRPKLSR